MTATHTTGPRSWAAWKLRDLSGFIWSKGKLGEVRYLGEVDLALINFVAALDRMANELDGACK